MKIKVCAETVFEFEYGKVLDPRPLEYEYNLEHGVRFGVWVRTRESFISSGPELPPPPPHTLKKRTHVILYMYMYYDIYRIKIQNVNLEIQGKNCVWTSPDLQKDSDNNS